MQMIQGSTWFGYRSAKRGSRRVIQERPASGPANTRQPSFHLAGCRSILRPGILQLTRRLRSGR